VPDLVGLGHGNHHLKGYLILQSHEKASATNIFVAWRI